MNEEDLKGKPLTKEETKALLDLVESSKAITTKKTNASTNKMKNEEWERITRAFNSTTATRCPRASKELRLKWENLKKLARKRSGRIRLNNMQTGGGVAEYIPPDDILDRVASILGSTATGYDDVYGGDMDPQICGGSGPTIEVYCGESSGGGGDEEGAGVLGGGAAVIEPDDEALPAPCSDAQIITPLKRKKFSPMLTGKRKKGQDEDACARIARNVSISNYYNKKRTTSKKKWNINSCRIISSSWRTKS